ncbi:MAG: Trm112 family protein, partial [Candidatus Hermodarchaeota archaeon]
MNFWLFDCLACPIDKFYPLTLYTFSYETKVEEIDSYINILEIRDLDLIKSENIFDIEGATSDLLIRDNLILEFTSVRSYLQLILKSINEFDNIIDKSSKESIKISINIIKDQVKQVILEFLKTQNLGSLDPILPELFFLNKIKLDVEIESGLLFCPKCTRWYPIRETIPQMLPDEFRKEDEDIQ